ncbi:Hypothetical predicted protein [Lynx pardinus]|uniref:Uncharacterized protein n=1 Tax=Lynx pardinus TaxID=191816 RepID=A0A485P000_LYNPA|nr:Hypothetical predicted protein [Lynx pardinus]
MAAELRKAGWGEEGLGRRARSFAGQTSLGRRVPPGPEHCRGRSPSALRRQRRRGRSRSRAR